jgi:hypothetical protein
MTRACGGYIPALRCCCLCSPQARQVCEEPSPEIGGARRQRRWRPPVPRCDHQSTRGAFVPLSPRYSVRSTRRGKQATTRARACPQRVCDATKSAKRYVQPYGRRIALFLPKVLPLSFDSGWQALTSISHRKRRPSCGPASPSSIGPSIAASRRLSLRHDRLRPFRAHSRRAVSCEDQYYYGKSAPAISSSPFPQPAEHFVAG